MHTILPKLYDLGKLPNYNLSDYLDAFALPRHRWLLHLAVKARLSPLSPHLARQFPLGHYLLVNHRFSSCCPSYPFINRQITLCFLKGSSLFCEGKNPITVKNVNSTLSLLKLQPCYCSNCTQGPHPARILPSSP